MEMIIITIINNKNNNSNNNNNNSSGSNKKKKKNNHDIEVSAILSLEFKHGSSRNNLGQHSGLHASGPGFSG